MNINQIMELKAEIDKIKEYVDSELCKKCMDMDSRLQECQKILKSLESKDE